MSGFVLPDSVTAKGAVCVLLSLGCLGLGKRKVQLGCI